MIAFRHQPAFKAVRYQLCDVATCARVATAQVCGRALCGSHATLLRADLEAAARASLRSAAGLAPAGARP